MKDRAVALRQEHRRYHDSDSDSSSSYRCSRRRHRRRHSSPAHRRRRYSSSDSGHSANTSSRRHQATSVNVSAKSTTDVERPTAVEHPTAAERSTDVDHATDVNHPTGVDRPPRREPVDVEAPQKEARSTAVASRCRKRRRRSPTSSDSSEEDSPSPKHCQHRTTSKRRAQDSSGLSTSADRADARLSVAPTAQKGARSHRPAPISLQQTEAQPLHQHQESPTSMDEFPSELLDKNDFEDENDSYCSEDSSPPNLPTPKTDILGSQPPSPSEDMKLYSQTIHKIASVMELQVQQEQTADSCKFFGHLNRRQTAQLRLAFIPSLLDHIKEVWNKPSSAPLMSHRVDNMYRTHGDGTSFLDKHPLPNSLVVDATQNRAKGCSGRKLDIIGCHHYSLASFSLRSANYLCAMEAYSRHILLQVAPMLDSLPEEQKAKITALHEELLSLIDYETLVARNMAAAAAKQLSTAIYLRRHAWLRTTNIPDDARNRIEDSPFDGEGLFAITTDESLDTLVKMRKTAKSITYSTVQPQGQYRRQQQNWQRQASLPQRRDLGRFRQNYQPYSYRENNHASSVVLNPPGAMTANQSRTFDSVPLLPPHASDIRLHPFLHRWSQITSDKWVLEIISQGYALEFSSLPPFGTGPPKS
ncbi:hypothetical protein JRQ81_000841 [Phrynocephalus forsythii]|uniref:Uncharacterized protein n=1 Tax=Phrynocephalus forsythii TaxID=171643 RepID=A0A9Q0Y8G1_9SAUR|nr:hypothetical protein JRQ81_000841 [Phrynocephalus forsythii]